MQIIDTPEGIRAYRLLALRAALGLEVKGLKGRVNAYATIKKEFNLKGSKQKVYDLYEAKLREMKILV
jgi:hypothetical protein